MAIYNDIGNDAIYMQQLDGAIMVLTKELKEANKNNFYKFEFNSLSNLFLIYFKMKDYNQLEDLKLYLVELLKKDNKAEYHNLLYKYINMYSLQKKKNNLDSLVTFAIRLNQQKSCCTNYLAQQLK